MATQINYIIVRRKEGILLKDCRAIPRKSCLAQRRLVCIVIVRVTSGNRGKRVEKIKHWKLKKEAIRRDFEENEGIWRGMAKRRQL